jgi:tetratricopeptide (TPR) repeat protein
VDPVEDKRPEDREGASERDMGWRRVMWSVLLVGVLALGGCATPKAGPKPETAADDPPARVEIRSDAPPEYDLLVAQQLTVEGRNAEAAEAYLRAVAKDDQSAYLHRKAAVALAQQNRLEEALEHAQRAAELDPEDDASRIFLGQLYRIRREVPQAEETLRDDAGEPVSPDAAFLLYQIYMDGGRFEDGLDIARWLVENEPDGLRGRVAEANAYQRMERPADAERALRQALEQDPGNLRIYGALARMLRERGDYEAEVAVYDEVILLHPHHHSTLVALGEAQLALEDIDGSIATFEAVEERYPDDLESAVRLGYLLFEANRFDEAEHRFERVLAANPEEYDVGFFLGVVRRRRGDGDGAITAFESIPVQHRYYPEARAQIASVLERRGEYELALAAIGRANAVRPSREFELYEATLRAKTGDLEGAVESVQSMLSEEPENDDLLFNLGVVYGEAQRTDEALDYMHQALEKNPDNASALNYIGYTWAEKGVNLDEAEEMISRAIELRPEDGYIVDSLGWVYYMRARPLVDSGRSQEARPLIDRALSELERAHELTGGDPVISEHLGDTYLLLDEKQRALEKFEEAIRLEPREGEQPHLFEKFETLRRELQ